MNRSSNTTDVNAQVGAIWASTRDVATRHVRRRAGAGIDHALLEDAVTEATLRLHRHLQAGGTVRDAEVPGWMCVVTWREYLRIIERRDRGDVELYDGHEAYTTDPITKVIEQLGDNAIAEAFAAATARLSGHQRTVLADYAEGRSYDEIAARHGLSTGAVNKALARAKRTLRGDRRLAQQVTAWRD